MLLPLVVVAAEAQGHCSPLQQQQWAEQREAMGLVLVAAAHRPSQTP